MKQIIRYISVVVLLLFSTAASARGGVESKVEIASLTNGTITSSLEGLHPQGRHHRAEDRNTWC